MDDKIRNEYEIHEVYKKGKKFMVESLKETKHVGEAQITNLALVNFIPFWKCRE